MDRIDFIRKIVDEFGADIFYSREGKLRKALRDSALTFQDIEDLVECCTTDRKISKKILTEPDISKTRDLQKELVVIIGGKSIAPLKDVHTAIYNYEQKTVTDISGEFDDGRFVYSVVSGRKQCLRLIRSLTPPAYDLVIPDTVPVEKKEYKIVSIEDGCFEGNDKITSVKLPMSLEVLGKNVFCNCSSLTKVEIPRSLKSIGNNAFAYSAIESLVLQDHLEEIGQMAFYRCRKLRAVEMTKRTSQIGVGAFTGCSSLEEMRIEDKNGRFMFQDGVLYSRKQDRIIAVAGTFKGKLSPPRTLLTIEQYAAEGCEGITELDLPLSLQSIGACAFKDCVNITKVKFPNTVEKIGERSFENCPSIGSLSIPASVTAIGKLAFKDCIKIETANVDGKLCYRNLRIFEGCKGLNRITIRKSSDYTDADFPKNTRVKFAHE